MYPVAIKPHLAMNGEQTSNQTKNETTKPHRIDPDSPAVRPKEGWRRRLPFEKLVRLSNEWCNDRRKYSRLRYFISP